MPNRIRPTWIAVMDGVQARFFVLRRGDDGQTFEEIDVPMPAKSAGRKVRLDKSHDSMQFVREIAGTLDAALADKRYDRLVLVGPPRNLAELREALSVRVRETLVHQVPKNLTKLGTEALWKKLSLIVLKAARPVNGSGERVATASGNGLPVSVVFRNMEPSPSVQSIARKYAAKLGRKFGRIQNCRVIVDAPKHTHRKVKEFRVAVDLKLPGHEIASKSASGEGGPDINTVLREAFETAARQLQDRMQRIKRGVVRERRQSSPRMRGLPA